MAYLIFLLVALALFIGFLVLTQIEARRGARLLAKERAKLDLETERLVEVMENTDIQAFVHETFRLVMARIAHDLAHAALVVTRFAERLLTQAVRTLRTRHLVVREPSGTPRSEFVAQMKEFKAELKSNGKKLTIESESESRG